MEYKILRKNRKKLIFWPQVFKKKAANTLPPNGLRFVAFCHNPKVSSARTSRGVARFRRPLWRVIILRERPSSVFFCFQTSSGGGIENLSLRRVTADKMFCFVSQVCLKRTLFGPSDQNSLVSVLRKSRWKLQIKSSFVGLKKVFALRFWPEF